MALPPQATHLLVQIHGIVSASTEFAAANSRIAMPLVRENPNTPEFNNNKENLCYKSQKKGR